MRSGALLALPLLALSSLVGCGGGEDAEAVAEARTVTSDDGLATLDLPAGAPAGVTVAAVDGGYRLEPSGTTFDEPARLTMRDVDLGGRGGAGLVLLDGEPVASEVTYDEGADVATIAVDVPHFSDVQVVGSYLRLTYDLPDRGVVGQPLGGSLSLLWERDRVGSGDREQQVLGVRASASITNRGTLQPAEARAFPTTQLGLGVASTHAASISCQGRGTGRSIVLLRYTTRWAVAGAEPRDVGDILVLQEGAFCAAATDTDASLTTVKPTIQRIGALLEVPVTTYVVEPAGSEEAMFEYEWRIAGEPCGTPRAPFTAPRSRDSFLRWSHSGEPPDGCEHAGTDHDVTVSVTVHLVGAGSVTCVIQGSNAQVIENPPCA